MAPTTTPRSVRRTARRISLAAFSVAALAGLASSVLPGGSPVHAGRDRVFASSPAAVATPSSATSVDPAGYGLHGSPDVLAQYWTAQSVNDCVPMSAADIIGQLTGTSPSEAAITAEAAAEQVVDPNTQKVVPMYDPQGGMYFTDMPQLLAHYGVSAELTHGASLPALETALDSGRPVAVSLDAEKVWDAVWNQTQPDPGQHDHVVVVTGLDESKGIVYLNDSGIDLSQQAGREEQVPLSVFEASWATSGNTMIVASSDATNPVLLDPIIVNQNAGPSTDIPASGFDWSSLLTYLFG